METWEVLAGHENYLVSSCGRIKHKKTGKIHYGSVNSKGYIRFDLSENGKRFTVSGHRAVAEAFIANEENKPAINHKDGDKTNNCVDNLEWCTQKENTVHAFTVLGNEAKNKKRVMCVETGAVYDSISDAERITGIQDSCIIRCCKGHRQTTHKTHWKYVS